jgi:hypothetical protein
MLYKSHLIRELLKGMINMTKDKDKKKLNLILTIIISIISIITTVFVIVLGVKSNTSGYEYLLFLSPLIIGLVVGLSLINKSHTED